MEIRTVFLDAGGVLVLLNWEQVSETLARHGIAVAAQRLRDAEPIVKKRMDTAEIIHSTRDGDRFATYLQSIITEAGVIESQNFAPAVEELLHYNSKWNLWETIPSDVIPTLAALRSKSIKLVVLSNSNGTLRESFERFGLLDKVDYLFDSHEEGVEKPDPAYFHHALKVSGSSAGTTIHVGDFYHVDVIGARNAGIRPILLDAANLYEECDCERIRTLSEILGRVAPIV
jgi:putative hydrolase of the HAD superfamily